MPKAFVINRCIFCGALPCECEKPATKSRHPTKVQNTKRRGTAAEKKEPPKEATPQPSPPVLPDKPKKSVPRAQPIKSFQAPAAPAPVETESFAEIRALSENDEMERAIKVLRDAGLIHPHDPHNSPGQRAALWRAQAWRRRHGSFQ